MVNDSEIFERMRKEIQNGTVRHRCCDVCGCELAMPDVGLYGRESLNTVACTNCSYTKAHRDFLVYVENLRKTYTKQEVLKMLDERLNETWGGEVSVFTIDEWNEQTRGERFKCVYCGESFEEKDFGTNCKKCGYLLLPQEYGMCDGYICRLRAGRDEHTAVYPKKSV